MGGCFSQKDKSNQKGPQAVTGSATRVKKTINPYEGTITSPQVKNYENPKYATFKSPASSQQTINYPSLSQAKTNVYQTSNQLPFPLQQASDQVSLGSHKPKVASTQPTVVGAMLASNAIRITIKPINGDKEDILVSKQMTGGELKQYIYEKISDSLKPNQMSILYEGTVIGKNKKLSAIQLVVGSQLKITQSKIQIGEVNNIIADIYGIDLISDEVGVAQMCCGHKIGRDTMTAMIRSLVSLYKFQIKCPYPDQNQQTCNALWDFKDCRKVGVFTKEELQEFETGLSMNWIRENSKICPNPKCAHQICKADLKTNRVVCSKCGFGDFCFNCLKKWNGSGSSFCGNEECRIFAECLQNCSWSRQFSLRDKADGNKFKTYNTPQYRACPHCMSIIENSHGCKQMKCKGCQKGFCWVCLQIQKNGSYPCGSWNDYCGKVAKPRRSHDHSSSIQSSRQYLFEIIFLIVRGRKQF